MPDTSHAGKRIPVVLDTDIGGDIDDTWALAMLLNSPELDLKLVVSDTGNTVYRGELLAKLLEVAHRTDVPIGIGLRQSSDNARERQRAWLGAYRLEDYPGRVYQDGVAALIDTLMSAPEPVTLICIGPVPNVAEALRREPGIAARTRFVGMHGSFAYHHRTNLHLSMEEGPIAEWNVVCDVAAAQAVFAAPWLSATITPLDTCACVVLDGARYARVRDAAGPLPAAVIENYRVWSPHTPESDPERHSSVLYDTVAVYLAFSRQHLRIQRMGVCVDERGFTIADPAARPFDVALAWEDLNAYLDLLVARILGPIGEQ